MQGKPSQSIAIASTGSRVVFAILFMAAGVAHFVMPAFYLKVMPPYIPFHEFCVFFSGAAEIVLGVLLLLSRTKKLAAWGMIALLVAVFPANLYVYQHQEMFPLPAALHFLRLPFQGVLILWAYGYTRSRSL